MTVYDRVIAKSFTGKLDGFMPVIEWDMFGNEMFL
jgi:hypothetical protein